MRVSIEETNIRSSTMAEVKINDMSPAQHMVESGSRPLGRRKTLGAGKFCQKTLLNMALNKELVEQNKLEQDMADDSNEQVARQNQSFFRRELRLIKQTFWHSQSRALLLSNLLFLFVPLGFVADYYAWSSKYVFAFNFMSIIPVAQILLTSTAALSLNTGSLLGGLLNATLGNTVEMAVTISAIRTGLVRVVQMSLTGSILSNLLLVLGMSFMAAGVKSHQSNFNSRGAGSSVTCLVLASLALTLPTVFSYVPGTTPEDGLMLSRIIALVMAFVYMCFICFSMGTHSSFFTTSSESFTDEAGVSEAQVESIHPATAAFFGTCSCISVVFCAERLVRSICAVSEEYGIPYAFIGIILLPIVGNASEHLTAVTAAYHDLMDLSLAVAVGSSTQIALFVIPFSVISGWVYDVPLSLDFELFCTMVLMLSVFISSGVLADGSGNWFEGLMLISTYAIVAIITWYLPDQPQSTALPPERELTLGAALFLNQTAFDI